MKLFLRRLVQMLPARGVLTLVVLTSCGRPTGQAERVPGDVSGAVLPLLSSDSLGIQAYAYSDTVRSADSLFVGYLVRNGSTTRVFVNASEFYTFEVLDPDGRRVPRTPPSSETQPEKLDGMKFVLPGNGFVGKALNLACVDPSSVPDIAVPPGNTCAWGHALSKAGTYKIVVRYMTYPPPGISEPVAGKDYLSLQADTVTVVYAPKGPRMP